MKRMTTFSIAALMAITMGCSNCGDSPYKRVARGYRAVNLTARLAEDFDDAVKKHLEVKHAQCKATHKIKTAEFDACVLPAVRLSRTWTGSKAGQPTGKGVLPTLQDAQRVTRLALDTAYDYVKGHEAECKGKTPPAACGTYWVKLLRPSLCALVVLVDRGMKIGAFSKAQSTTYKTVMGFVTAAGGCKE
jgi:hypothetical protein